MLSERNGQAAGNREKDIQEGSTSDYASLH